MLLTLQGDAPHLKSGPSNKEALKSALIWFWDAGTTYLRVFSFLLIASDDGERLCQNPLQVPLLCVGKTAIMYAKSAQREDCTSVVLDGFRLSCRLR